LSGLYPSIIEEGLALLGVKTGSIWRLAGQLRTVLEPYAVRSSRVKRLSRFLKRIFLKKSENQYSKWVSQCDTLSDHDRELIRRHLHQLPYQPLISIVLPVFNTPEKWLRLCLESVVNQLYPHWQLCVTDDASTLPHCYSILSEYARRDSRIKIVWRTQNGHIARATNSALEAAEGDFVALLDHDDTLAEHALYMVTVELNQCPEADLIYSDEDKVDENEVRHLPHFKPDWNPDLFLSQNYINHLSVYRMSLVRKVGGFRHECLGSQDYDLALRIIQSTCGKKVRHIPHILYHWRAVPGSTACHVDAKDFADAGGRRALQDHFRELNINAEATSTDAKCSYRVTYRLPRSCPLVNIIIPTSCSNTELLERCVEGILFETDYPNLKITLVANNVKSYYRWLVLDNLQRYSKVAILQYDRPFNYSAIYNYAVSQTKGEVLGLLNDDLQVISPGWLKEMVSHTLRPEIGAVGPMLYYPDDTIQHAGIVLGLGGLAGHVHVGLPRGSNGYLGRARVTQDFSAITGACVVVRRTVYEKVAGFDEQLPVIANDVDFCMRLVRRGYRILWTPWAELYHVEQASRGSEDTHEGLLMRAQAVAYMTSKWGTELFVDPCYNPNLSLVGSYFEPTFSPRVKKPWVEVA